MLAQHVCFAETAQLANVVLVTVVVVVWDSQRGALQAVRPRQAAQAQEAEQDRHRGQDQRRQTLLTRCLPQSS